MKKIIIIPKGTTRCAFGNDNDFLHITFIPKECETYSGGWITDRVDTAWFYADIWW